MHCTQSALHRTQSAEQLGCSSGADKVQLLQPNTMLASPVSLRPTWCVCNVINCNQSSAFLPPPRKPEFPHSHAGSSAGRFSKQIGKIGHWRTGPTGTSQPKREPKRAVCVAKYKYNNNNNNGQTNFRPPSCRHIFLARPVYLAGKRAARIGQIFLKTNFMQIALIRVRMKWRKRPTQTESASTLQTRPAK